LSEVVKIPSLQPAPRRYAAPNEVLELVERTLDDHKAEDVVVIDLTGKSSIADTMVIATGRSQRQVVALAEHLREALDPVTRRLSIEGLPQGDWVLIDTGDVIVHVFRPEVRAFYNLEKMWGAALPADPAGGTSMFYHRPTIVPQAPPV
jgi:ribosome-associated protein